MSRDDFSSATKTKLAKRAGYRCSFPGCSAVTIGPSEESNDATSSTGTAAHISAAAAGPGARRYDPNISPEQRSSIDNGIWCCRTHGTLIDTDEEKYSVEMLKKWRTITEKKAQLRQAHGEIDLSGHADLIDIGLAPDEIVFCNNPHISETIGEAIQNAYLKEVWGTQISHAVRDFLIECARNSFTHASAKNIRIRINPSSVVLEHDGDFFDWSPLAQADAGRGGGMALRALLNALKINSITSKAAVAGKTEIHIPLIRDANKLPATNPCAMMVDLEMLILSKQPDLSTFSGCNKIYVVYHSFACYSDIYPCGKLLQMFQLSGLQASLILPDVSDEVVEFFRKNLPDFEVNSWLRR